MAGWHEHGAARGAVAERRVTGFLVDVVGLCLDDARLQPQPVYAVANDGSKQCLSDDLRVPVEKGVVEVLQRWFGEAVHLGSGFGRSDCSDRASGANIPRMMVRFRTGRQPNVRKRALPRFFTTTTSYLGTQKSLA